MIRTLTKTVTAVAIAGVIATVTATPANASLQQCLNAATDQYNGCLRSNPGWYGDVFCTIAYAVDEAACWPKEFVGLVIGG